MPTTIQTHLNPFLRAFETRFPRVSTRLRVLWPLALALLVLLTVWLLYPHAYEASDPWLYARNAHMLRDGSYFEAPRNTPFMQRIGLLIPLAAIDRTLGVTPRTSHLVPLLAAASILICIWFALEDRRSRGFALLIAITSGPLLVSTTVLYPDVVAAAFTNASLLVLFRRERPAPLRPVWFGVIGASLWFMAFLVKESAVWALPIWLVCAGADLRAGRRALLSRFYLPACLAGLVLAALYLYASQRMFGDPLARFAGIEALVDRHSWSLRDDAALHRRLWKSPFVFFARHYGVLCVSTLCAPLVMPRQLRFWAYTALLFVSAFWFGSAGLSAYRPLPLHERMSLLGAPAMYIASGYVMAWLSRKVPIRHALRWTAVLIVLLSVAPLRGFVASWHRDPEQRAMSLVKKELERSPALQVLLVCSDQRSADYLPIYFSFEPPANLTIVSAEQLADEQLSAADVAFFFVNEARSAFIARKYDLPTYDAQLRAGAPKVYARWGIALYRADEPRRLTKDQLLGLSAVGP